MGDFDDMNTQEFRDAKPADDGFPIFPKGDYEATGVKYELKASPEKGGNYHAFTFQVLNGDFKNQKIFKNFYANHPDPVERGKSARSFASLKIATGVSSPVNGSDLLEKPIKVCMDTMKPKDGSDPFSYVRNFKPRHAGPGGGFSNPMNNTTPPASNPGGPINNPFGKPA